jgi:hypothetical protein
MPRLIRLLVSTVSHTLSLSFKERTPVVTVERELCFQLEEATKLKRLTRRFFPLQNSSWIPVRTYPRSTVTSWFRTRQESWQAPRKLLDRFLRKGGKFLLLVSNLFPQQHEN